MLGRQPKLIATMKKLFLIVATLFVAVSFSACSDDDDNNGGPLTQMRYVKEIVSNSYTTGNDEISSGKVEFEYDNQWRITKYTCTDQWTDTNDNSSHTNLYIWEISYEGNMVHAKEINNPDWESDIVCELNNAGCVIKVTRILENDGPFTTEFTYNNEGRLIKCGDDTYKWIDGNRHDVRYDDIIFGSHKTPKCNIDFTTDRNFDELCSWIFPYNLLYCGKQSANLPVEEDGICSYKFDDKGYISDIILDWGPHYQVTYY